MSILVSTLLNGTLTRLRQGRIKKERKSPRRAHSDLHKIAVHAGTKVPRCWMPSNRTPLEFHSKNNKTDQDEQPHGANFIRRVLMMASAKELMLTVYKKIPGLRTEVFLKHFLNLKPKLTGRCPLVGRVVMVCEQCRMPQSLTRRQTREPY